MTRVLVTGASGLLGANLVLAWAERHEVIGVTHTARMVHPQLDSRQADLSEAVVARRLIGEVRPEAVVHCAAATDVEACERDPAMAHRLNVEMAQTVARAAAEGGARLLHVSTDAVFGGDKGPYHESDAAGAVNAYGRSKLAGETAVLEEYPGALVVRTNFFGWNPKPKAGLAEWFLGRLQAGNEAPGFTDVFWSPLLVNDLVDRLEVLLRADLGGVLHLPGRDCLSKFEFGRRLAHAFGLPEELVLPSEVSRAGLATPRPRRTCLDGAKAHSVLGVEAPSVDDGLRRLKELDRVSYPGRLRGMVQS